MMRCFFIQCATIGPIGYLPAPGTMGTLVTLPCVYYIYSYLSPFQSLLYIGALSIFSLIVVQQALQHINGSHDPQQIIIDEVVGCFITFWAVPLTWYWLLAGFILFRLFDIFKIGFVLRAEQLPRAWGIVADDMVAGLFATSCLHLLMVLLSL